MLINAGYYTTNFWDGRAASLEEQALGPIQNPDEMNQPLNELINELSAVKGYQERF
ncbi:cytochrome c peroxidase [Neobacillus niacini]|nr:cytochrome c peroxidase [Neobacillus niacini]